MRCWFLIFAHIAVLSLAAFDTRLWTFYCLKLFEVICVHPVDGNIHQAATEQKL